MAIGRMVFSTGLLSIGNPPVSGLLSSKLNPYVGLTGWGRGRYEGEVSEGSEGAGGGEDDGAEE
jgi:hypothetical protein